MTQRERFVAVMWREGHIWYTKPDAIGLTLLTSGFLPRLWLSDSFTERIDGNNRVGDVFGR